MSRFVPALSSLSRIVCDTVTQKRLTIVARDTLVSFCVVGKYMVRNHVAIDYVRERLKSTGPRTEPCGKPCLLLLCCWFVVVVLLL